MGSLKDEYPIIKNINLGIIIEAKESQYPIPDL